MMFDVSQSKKYDMLFPIHKFFFHLQVLLPIIPMVDESCFVSNKFCINIVLLSFKVKKAIILLEFLS